MEPDKELIEKVLNGDRHAFCELVRRNEKSVLAVTAHILGDLHLAEDATQETFVKMYQNLLSLKKYNSFGPWLLKIARYQALNMKIKQTKIKANPIQTDISAPSNGSLNPEAQNLLSNIMKLPPKQQRVIMLHYFDGHSVASVADLLNRPVGTVTKQLSRAYQRLRNMIKEH